MKQMACGGVVIDAHGRFLLRHATGNFGGYAWTFPKGGADPGEAPEAAALREVLEETGYTATIIAPLAKDFAGTTSITRFWLMRAGARVGDPDPKETDAVRWTTFEEAKTLIAETPSATGRARDLLVLVAARVLAAEHSADFGGRS